MSPVVSGWYADPELHLFAGRYYLYPTYSMPYDEQTFFEAWSSDDLEAIAKVQKRPPSPQ